VKSAKSRKVYTKVSDRSNRCGYKLTRAGTIHPPGTKYPKRPRSYNSFKGGECVVKIKNTEALDQEPHTFKAHISDNAKDFKKKVKPHPLGNKAGIPGNRLGQTKLGRNAGVEVRQSNERD
jgi:hypothetical protein